MSTAAPKKVSLQTVGCRLNQYETEKMFADLAPYGFSQAKKGEPADLYIINTCTVTHRADADDRYLIKKAARENPNGRIVVAGCYVDKDPSRVSGMEAVDVIIPNSEKDRIVEILPEKLPDLFTQEPDKGCGPSIAAFDNYNRAWLKVSDGCNQWCSFCILPDVRGRLRNRPALEIIEEINGLVGKGFNEVVLTGIHLGHYKNRKVEPQVKNLAHLCRMIRAETDVKRIRLSSIEPQTVRDDLLQMYADSNGFICHHMHLPLQSGSSRILKLMRRPYDQNLYLKRLRDVREAVPDTIIGADVIVGFPGETEDDFEKTRKVAESGLIDYMHVFSYSDRPGTTASEYPDKVNPEIIKERNTILSRISHKLRANAYRRQIGRTLEVIAEHKKPPGGKFWGIADNYVKVLLPHSYEGGRRIVKYLVTGAAEDHVTGELIE